MGKGYAKKVLSETYGLTVEEVRRRLKCPKTVNKQRVWILENTLVIPKSCGYVYQCDCGAYIGTTDRWLPCPKCYPELLETRYVLMVARDAFQDVVKIKLKDGLYCDYSKHADLGYVPGYAIVKFGKIVARFSCNPKNNIGNGEVKAVRLILEAHQQVHRKLIYCDHRSTCKDFSVSYVKRAVNPAHLACYKVIGFCSREQAIQQLKELYDKHFG
jgi:hypothetical protein